jgi:hypothetical protein
MRTIAISKQAKGLRINCGGGLFVVMQRNEQGMLIAITSPGTLALGQHEPTTAVMHVQAWQDQ